MDKEKFKDLVKTLTDEEKRELFQDLYNSFEAFRNSFNSKMEPVYKAVEPIASAISNFNQTVIEPFIKSESFQNTVNSIMYWLRNIDWQKVSDTFETNSKFCDEINEQLQTRNIDTSILSKFELSQIAELYIASDQNGLTFADMIEDNLQLFNQFDYENAQTYLNIINKRKNQTAGNPLKTLNVNETFVENLKYSEKNITELIGLALRESEKNTVSLLDEEKKVLNTLKQNRYAKDKELARILNYQPHEIEEMCANIRKKFNIDYFDDDNVKRNMLTCLATKIEII